MIEGFITNNNCRAEDNDFRQNHDTVVDANEIRIDKTKRCIKRDRAQDQQKSDPPEGSIIDPYRMRVGEVMNAGQKYSLQFNIETIIL